MSVVEFVRSAYHNTLHRTDNASGQRFTTCSYPITNKGCEHRARRTKRLLHTLRDEVDCGAVTAYVVLDIPRRTLRRTSLESGQKCPLNRRKLSDLCPGYL